MEMHGVDCEPRARGPVSTLQYAQTRWSLLSAADEEHVKAATHCPESVLLIAHYGDPETHWRRQFDQQSAGDCLTFVARRGRQVLGVAALLPYRDGVRTATFLAPDARGTGLNASCKQLLWSASSVAGLPLYAVIRSTNERSLRALRNVWPDAMGELVAEPDRLVHVFSLTDQPQTGTPLSSAERGALRKLIHPTPFGQRHLVPSRGPRMRRKRAPEVPVDAI